MINYGSGPVPGSGQTAKLIFEIISRNVFGKISVSVSAILHLDFENIFLKNLSFFNFYDFILIPVPVFDIQCSFFCFFEKIADTDTDIFPKTFLEIISENQFCILAGSGYGTGSVIFQPFSGSKMIFMLKYSLKSV
jgi:hypothetical protein